MKASAQRAVSRKRGCMPADSFVGIWKFIARRKFSGSRHYAKPPPRYRQAGDSAVETSNFQKISPNLPSSIKKKKMDLEKIKNEVIYSDNPSRLFEITIELTEEISKLYVSLGYTDDHKTKNELKGKISLLSTLQNIIDKRIEDVRTTDKVNERQELLSNRQFRIASQMVLKKETYERIVELSLLNYKKLKDQKNELKANKLE